MSLEKPPCPTQAQEELSLLLDQVNAGQTPETSSEENAELLEVAKLIRQSGMTAPPPPHILAETVAHVLPATLPSRRALSQKFFYSGLAGLAASLLIFAALRFFTPVPSPLATAPITPTPATQESPASTAPPPPSSIPSPAEVPAPPLLAQNTPSENNPPSPIASPPTPSLTATPPSNSLPVLSAALPEAAQPPAQTPPLFASRSAMLMAAPPVDTKKSLYVLAGKKPDTIKEDPDTGCIRQVYNQGTPNEIILTQRLLSDSRSRLPEKAAAYKTSLPFVTRTIHHWEIRLEGSLSAADLEHLAETLEEKAP